MTKGTRKTNRRLKKTVRKTLGTLFLISAIVVAAIPTEGLRAEEDAVAQAAGHTHAETHTGAKYKVSIRRNTAERTNDLLNGANSSIPVMEDLIPIVEPTDTIYTTGTNEDGTSYQFAYKMYDNDWAAIILGYNKSSNLPNNTLTIPDTVNAYIQPTGNMGTGQGYVAASSSGEPLYYEKLTEHTIMVDTTEQKTDSLGNPVFEDGKPVYVQEEKKYSTGEMVPCYATVDEWKNLPLENFYYYKSGSVITSAEAVTGYNGPKQTYNDFAQSGGDSTHQWIKAAAVKYIGNQYLDVQKDNQSHTSSWSIPNDGNGNYITEANADKGVFATAGNISTLNIGKNLVGIGNFAFYECTSLSSVSFGNGLKVLGNWAFAACGTLNNVAIPDAC